MAGSQASSTSVKVDIYEGINGKLLEELKELERLFTLTPQVLKDISKHFVSELSQGLSKEGGDIPMNVGWVMDYPTGQETGDYLAIDLGGTNLRIVLVTLEGNCKFSMKQSKFKLPEEMRTGHSDDLFMFIAECLKDFVNQCYPNGSSGPLPLGFTFSYPTTQYSINTGILQRWTKGFDIDGVEGHEVVELLQAAIEKVGISIDVVALINDTTGTLVSSMYCDTETKMGLIFGTGCNGAYFEQVKNIPKLEGMLPDGLHPEDVTAINCEYGAFDNQHKVLPRTKYDIQIDAESPRPNQQAFEKMISGYYLGEVLRLILIDFAEEKKLIFPEQDLSKLRVPFVMDTSYPARIEEDLSKDLDETNKLIDTELGVHSTLAERRFIRRVVELISERSARLSITGIAAICMKRGYKTAHCAADGSVVNRYPGFVKRAQKGLRDIFDWETEEDPIVIVHAQDGSGVGAAIIAALTQKRLEKGLPVGVKQSILRSVSEGK